MDQSRLLNKVKPVMMCFMISLCCSFFTVSCTLELPEQELVVPISNFNNVQSLVEYVSLSQSSSSIIIKTNVNSIPVKFVTYNLNLKEFIVIDRVLGLNVEASGTNCCDIKSRLPVIYFDSKHLFLDNVLVNFDMFRQILKNGFNNRKGHHNLIIVMSQNVTVSRLTQLINELPESSRISNVYFVGIESKNSSASKINE